MEEILASIRRIIESGDERPKPAGDVLHGHPAPSGGDAEMSADGPDWDFGTLARDFAPANADAPRTGAETTPSVDAEVTAAGDEASADHAAPVAAAEQPAEAADVFVAAPPSEPGSSEPEPVSLESSTLLRSRSRMPRREPMPRRPELPPRALLREGVTRDGLSLAGAFGREASPSPSPSSTDSAVRPAMGEEEATKTATATAAAAPTGALPDVTIVAADRIVPSTLVEASRPAPAAPEAPAAAAAPEVVDLVAGFDEEEFSSELNRAVGHGRDAAEAAGPVPSAPAPEPSVITAASSLMSEAAGAQVAAAFDDLARAIRDGQMKSMEEMAREMLRPMLQEWLDDNLPRIVERMVREEIERVSRGPRR